MPVVPFEELQAVAGADIPAGTKVFMWPATGSTFQAGDTGAPLSLQHYPDKTLHVLSSAFNGATVTLEGTNEVGTPTVGVVLKDALGTAISLTANGLVQVLENPTQVFPRVAAAVPTGLKILLAVSTPARR